MSDVATKRGLARDIERKLARIRREFRQLFSLDGTRYVALSYESDDFAVGDLPEVARRTFLERHPSQRSVVVPVR